MKRHDRTIYLVYQAGLANVFAVGMDTAKRVRLLQSDFHSCEMFARGMGQAGEKVRSVACNLAGDISDQPWSVDLESAPFSDKFHPAVCN